MPRERSLVSYANDHYMALCRRVDTTQAPIVVPMTRGQAATLRGEIYAWRRVAEANPLEAAQRGIDLEIIRRVSFRVGGEGLTALPQSALTGPAAIEAALGKIERALTPEARSLENLKAAVGAISKEDRPLPYDLGDKK